MRQFLLVFLLLGIGITAFAQPSNDDCLGLIDLGVAPICDSTNVYSNVGATPSNVAPPPSPCFEGDVALTDVWFSFIASDTIIDYTLTVSGITDGMGSDPMTQPQIAIYRGDCGIDPFTGDTIIDLAYFDVCGSAELGEDVIEVDALGLTPGAQYFIRISDYSQTLTPEWGSFIVCIIEKEPISTISDGGSTACTGILTDTGGENGDYENDEDNVFSICPPAPSNGCVTFNLQYYNIENQDAIIFYDGPDTNSPIITDISGASGSSSNGDTDGGVCYSVQASNGCLTIEFNSDGTGVQEGFLGSWECSIEPCQAPQSITVDPTATETQIIASLSTPQVSVTIDTIICADGSIGTFLSPNNELGLEKGIIMTSGLAADAVASNFNASTAVGPFALDDGDRDLEILAVLNGETGIDTVSNDACIVELDVFAATNELSFEYIFGSEEYPEFVDDFNDIFAFFISGPGVVGIPELNNQKNIAALPTTTTGSTTVEINNVNAVDNWEYYRDNPNEQIQVYDGLTSDFLASKKSLTARETVIPCNSYHLKLSISDRGDSSWDSGVFISDLKGGTPNLAVEFASGIDYLVEGCTTLPDELIISLSNPLEDTISYIVEIGGTATQDVDYTMTVPTVITFLPGQTELTFPITPIDDMISEGTETIEISLTNNFGCGDVVYTTIVIELRDDPEVQILLGQDTVLVCQDSSILLEASGMSTYFWEPVGIFDNASSATPTATPTESQWVYVTGNVNFCVDVDSVYLQLIDPQITATALDSTNICLGDAVPLSSTNNANDQNLMWTPALGLDDPNIADPVATPGESTTYVASINIAGCIATDTVVVNVDTLFFPTLTFADTTICQGYPVQLANEITSTTDYSWTPTSWLDDPTLSGPTATPEANTTYTLIGTSANGYCADTASLNVVVIPADVDITNDDYIELCLGDTLDLTANTSTMGIGFEWTKDLATLDSATDTIVTARPITSTWYVAQVVIGACTVFDSVFVQVDSLPVDLTISPMDTMVCQGELVLLQTPVYEPTLYPNIVFDWSPEGNFESPDSLLNLVVRGMITTTFQRITVNGGCRDTAMATVNVTPVNELVVTPMNPTICFGDSITLIASSPGVTDFTWTPDDGTLTCTDCTNPTVFPSGTTNYMVEAQNDGCPIFGGTTVNVVYPPAFNLVDDQTICLNESIVLNQFVDPNPNTTYSWTSLPAGFSSTAAQPSVSPTETTTYILTASNPECGEVEAQVTIEVVTTPSLTVPDDVTICLGETVSLSATTSQNNPTIEWLPGPNEPTIEVAPQTTTTYIAVYTYSCGSLTDSVKVTVLPRVDITGIDITPNTTEVELGDQLTLQAILDPVDTPNLTFTWTDNQEQSYTGNPIVSTPQNLTDQPTNVCYIATAVNDFGCDDTFEVCLDVYPPQVLIADAFTPNGDGTNDYFNLIVKRGNVVIDKMQIFNRWGQLLYDNEDPNQGWDGTFNGTLQPSDVYIYIVEITQGINEKKLIKGDVSLIR